MKIFKVKFEGVWPVGNCLIILAEDYWQAIKIASKTIAHTNKFEVEEVIQDKQKVIIYLSGDY